MNASNERLAPLGRWFSARLDPANAPGLAVILAGLDPWRTLGYSQSALLRYLVRPDPALHRHELRAGDRTAGLLCVRYPWLRGPCLELLAIFPEHQGLGLGQTALDWIETNPDWAAANVWVTVSDFNDRGRAFYRKCGYLEVAMLPGLVSPGRAEVLLRKMVVRPPRPHPDAR